MTTEYWAAQLIMLITTLFSQLIFTRSAYCVLGGAQPIIPPNLYNYSMNIIAWGPQVK